MMRSSPSKSTKKSKSRSKASKNSGQVSQAQDQMQLPHADTASTNQIQNASIDAVKEKIHHRSYAGFGAKTVKVIWEQYDTSDMEIASDVFTTLAEDVTYKVWEVSNHIKTFARHSGGRVTCDLVNEVLKEIDVPPIIGSSDFNWEKIEYDGTVYCNSDRHVDLYREFVSDTQIERSLLPELSSMWAIDRKNSENLSNFASSLLSATFKGDEEAFKFAIETAISTPHIGCSLKLILKKCIEILAFEQTYEVVECCLKFLSALARNPHSRDMECREQLFHLSELLVCLLLGSLDTIIPRKINKREHSFEVVRNYLENPDFSIKKEHEVFNQMEDDDIAALFRIINREDLLKTEITDSDIDGSHAGVADIKQHLDFDELRDEEMHCAMTGDPMVLEHSVVQDSVTLQHPQLEIQQQMQSLPIQSNTEHNNCPEFSPYRTDMCEMPLVNNVCDTLGHLGCRFGYLQMECTYLIVRRMEKFFESRQHVEGKDFEFISRCVRGLISLGETAFREIIPFLEKIEPNDVPEWIYEHFSPAAVFLNGRYDIFLYEWLEDLCGEKLQPFMLHFNNYILRKERKFHKFAKPPTFCIEPKITFKVLENRKEKNLFEFFPETVQKPIKIAHEFRFSGCRKKPLKLKAFDQTIESIVQKPLSNFLSRTIIARRRLLKPLTNRKRRLPLMSFCYSQI